MTSKIKAHLETMLNDRKGREAKKDAELEGRIDETVAALSRKLAAMHAALDDLVKARAWGERHRLNWHGTDEQFAGFAAARLGRRIEAARDAMESED